MSDMILLLSCGCQQFSPGDWKVGDYTRCPTHSQIVGYNPDNGDPEFDRDVKVITVVGHSESYGEYESFGPVFP